MSVTEFYSGKSILVTGGTGFLGKVLIETLLRTCNDINTIYVLIRPSKRLTVEQRLATIIESELFSWLRINKSESLCKLIAVKGDISEPGLDLSPFSCSELVNNVSIVFHSAANIKFTESLTSAVKINLEGTKNILQLAKKMNELQALVYISTAYSNCNQEEILEQIYKTPKRPSEILDITRILDQDLVDAITPSLIQDWPNTYTYTKALAENLLHEEKEDLPVAILRPSIVTATFRGEVPGWLDNVNGITGGIVAYSKGLLHNLYVDRNDVVDIIPVDYVANEAIVVAWHVAMNRKREIEVYNIASGIKNGLRWEQFYRDLVENTKNYPPSKTIWYTTGKLRSNMVVNKVCCLFQHTIPAIFFDTVACLVGKSPRFLKLVQRMDKAFKASRFGISQTYNFSTTNTEYLNNCLTEEDREKFYFNAADIKWSDYLKTYYLGIRKYILHEDLSTVNKGITNMKWKYMLHQMTKLMLLWIAIRPIVKIGPILQTLWTLCIQTVYKFTSVINYPQNHHLL